MAKLLELLRTGRARPAGPAPAPAAGTNGQRQTAPAAPSIQTARDPKRTDPATEFVPYQPVRKGSRGGLSEPQQQHLEALIERLVRRTQGSRQYTQDYRPYLADNRPIAGFRLGWKDLCYPLVVARGAGSHIWDVDGNEYVDLTMGFGTLLFGHSPSFIMNAIEEEIRRGLRLGPQSDLAGKVARLLCETTGTERALFCNSGTEAVMTALRIARAVTGRTRIALFPGSFHGTFDGTLVRGELGPEGGLKAVPMAPGVSASMMNDLLLLPYDSPESIELLKTHGHEVAAVLIEPTRSRRPDVQPVEFLRELYQVTRETGTALIFDEIITGFRLHAGGAQALFGIQADLVTYGKALTGGMPIGVVAGKARYMDAIDGGMWGYGDDSYPQAETTFFAGTFCKHPLAMAAAWAVLNHFRESGPRLHAQLNERTGELAAALNAYFEAEEVPIKAVNFGSLFRFHPQPEFRFIDFFFFHMLEKGIYIWEGRNCFLGLAHTEDDLARVVSAVKESVAELRAGGFLPSGPTRTTFASPDGGARGQAVGHVRAGTTDRSPVGMEDWPSGPTRTPASRQAQRLPLMAAQKHLWLATQRGDSASIAYNQALTLTLRGPLAGEALFQAVQEVIRRHQAFRTTFSPEGDYQEVAADLILDLPLVDFSNLAGEAREARVATWLDDEMRRPFDLAGGPLLRVHVLKLAAQEHRMVIVIHHLITDGKSVGTFLEEVGALYSARAAGQALQLPAPAQISEYAAWLEQTPQRAAAAAAETYWQQRFAGGAPVLELPIDRPRPALQTYLGARECLALDPERRVALQQLGARQGCTLYMTLLAGFQVLLHRLTGQTDLVVGIPIAGQLAMGADRLTGYCLNILPLRSQMSDDATFAGHLKSVKRAVLEAQDHQNYPFGDLINALNLNRDRSRPPLIATTFNLDLSSGRLDWHGLEVELATHDTGSAPFEIALNITDTGSRLVLECTYNTDLFEAGTIRRWLSSLDVLFGEVARAPEGRVWELPLLDQAERAALAEWNATHTAYPQARSLAELFEDQVARSPDAVAVRFEGAELPYRLLNTRANQLAQILIDLGVGPETPVAVCLERSLDLIVSLVAILKAGGAYASLDPAYPPQRLKFMLDDLAAPVVITHSRLAAALPDCAGHILCLDTDQAAIAGSPRDGAPGSRAISPDHLAYISYTSGSTGQPKGVRVTHRGVIRLVKDTNYAAFDAGQVFLQLAPVAFDASTLEIWGALLNGGCLVVFPAGTPDLTELGRVIAAERITTLWLTAGLFHQMVEQHLPQLSGVRQLLAGGESLSVPHVTQALRALPDGSTLINGYGPTENTTFTCCYPMRPGDRVGASVPIGRPIANTQVYILDRRMQRVPIGVVGELYTGGDGLARDYLNQPDLTAEKFLPNPFASCAAGTGQAGAGTRLYKTGDLARWRADGNIEFLGRLDSQVKLRGFRVEPGEIEAALQQHPEIQIAVVVASENSNQPGDKRLTAYYVPRPQAAPGPMDLRRHLKNTLPEHMIPSAFVPLEALPLSPNGKIDTRALPAPSLEDWQAQAGTFTAPRNEVEQTLVEIWEDVLDVPRVGIFDNFFEIGGHSLLATQIASRIRETFQAEVSLQHLFEAPTVAELAAHLVQSEVGQADPEMLAQFIENMDSFRGEPLSTTLTSEARSG
jgi:amino acid adenylation domain-containing protein